MEVARVAEVRCSSHGGNAQKTSGLTAVYPGLSHLNPSPPTIPEGHPPLLEVLGVFYMKTIHVLEDHMKSI
jgi:hypothetical protein